MRACARPRPAPPPSRGALFFVALVFFSFLSIVRRDSMADSLGSLAVSYCVGRYGTRQPRQPGWRSGSGSGSSDRWTDAPIRQAARAPTGCLCGRGRHILNTTAITVVGLREGGGGSGMMSTPVCGCCSYRRPERDPTRRSGGDGVLCVRVVPCRCRAPAA